MKLKRSTKILIVAVFVGLSLALYPSFADYINQKHATVAVADYTNTLNTLDTSAYQELWNKAVEYNLDLANRENPFLLSDEMAERYYNTLSFSDSGMIGYIEIPKLDVSLPVYHGTSESVLQNGIGHLTWTALPVGGVGTHCVVSGHRGLTSAKLFTDLDQLREGDDFSFIILNEEVSYEVDQIRTVLPNELSDLRAEPGKDYCTLVTCTPYGINTHRLLVRGHRIERIGPDVRVVSEAVLVDQLVVATVLAIPLLFTLFMMVMLKKPEKKPDLSQLREQ